MQGEPFKTFTDPTNPTTLQNLVIYFKNKVLLQKIDPNFHRHLQTTPYPHNIPGASDGTFPGLAPG